MQFIIEIAIEPKSEADQKKLGVALPKLAAEDPSFRVSTDPESGQTILCGSDEWHLDAKLDVLINDLGIGVLVGAPQVAYRETLGRKAEIDYTHKRQTGSSGQFARVRLVFEPGELGSGYAFESKIVDGSVPGEYIPGVEKGLEASKDNGLLAGFPLIDFKATLIDGAYHDLDSSVLAFEIAARAAFKELRDKAEPRLLWPIMLAEVTTPEEYSRAVIGDLGGRGAVLNRDERDGALIVTARVALAHMIGYAATLEAMTEGCASFAMRFECYEPIEPDEPPEPFAPAAALRA